MVPDNPIRESSRYSQNRDSGYHLHNAQPSAGVPSSAQLDGKLKKKGSKLLRKIKSSLWNGSLRGKQVPTELSRIIDESRESNENKTPFDASTILQVVPGNKNNTKNDSNLGRDKEREKVEMIDEQKLPHDAKQHSASGPIRVGSQTLRTTSSETHSGSQTHGTRDESQLNILPPPTKISPELENSSHRAVETSAHVFNDDIYSGLERVAPRGNWLGMERSSIAHIMTSDSDYRSDWWTALRSEPSILQRSPISPVGHVTSETVDGSRNYETSVNANYPMRSWTVSAAASTIRPDTGSLDEEPLLGGSVRSGSLRSQQHGHGQPPESLRQGHYRSQGPQYEAQDQPLGPGPSNSGWLEGIWSGSLDKYFLPPHTEAEKYPPALTRPVFVGKGRQNPLRSYPDISKFRFPPPPSRPRYPVVNPNFERERLEAEEYLYVPPSYSNSRTTIYTPPRTPRLHTPVLHTPALHTPALHTPVLRVPKPHTPIFHTPPPPGVEYTPVEVEPFLVPCVTISPDPSMIDMCMEINRIAEKTPEVFTSVPAAQNGTGTSLESDPTTLGSDSNESASEVVDVAMKRGSNFKMREERAKTSKRTIPRAISKACSKVFSRINRAGRYRRLDDARED